MDLSVRSCDVSEVETAAGFEKKRAQLIAHFTYCAQLPRDHADAVKWPKRNGAKPKST